MRTDEELLELCQSREARAWEELVRRYQERLLNLAYQFCGNREEARDLAQDIFVRLYENVERYDPGRSAKVWMYSLARNLCIDHYRRRKRRSGLVDKPVDEFRDLAAKSEPPDRRVLERSRREALTRALNALGSISREAIVLKDLQDLSLEEMARLLEVPIGTVKSRISRARVELGRALLREHPGEF